MSSQCIPEETSVISNNQWIFKARPSNLAKDENDEHDHSHLDPSSFFSKRSDQKLDTALLQDGQIVAQVLYISIDPTNDLGWIDSLPRPEKNDDDDVVPAVGIAQVIKSKHRHFHEGEIVHGLVGWQQYLIINPDDDKKNHHSWTIDKPPDNISLQSLICMPSALTAFYAMTDKVKIRNGDTVLIGGAAAAGTTTTGFVAGQMAKILGAKTVVGIVDSPTQKQWLLSNTSRFDAIIDTSNEPLHQRLQQIFANDGVKVYFDCSTIIGNDDDDGSCSCLLDTVLQHLAHGARVVVCGGGDGAIFPYNSKPKRPCRLENVSLLASKSVTVFFFQLHDYKGQFLQGITFLNILIKFKRLTLKMEQHDGFDNLPATLARVVNDPATVTGAQVVKFADPPLPIRTDCFFKTFIRGLTALVFVGMMDKLVNTVEDRAENVAIDKLSNEIKTQTEKHKHKRKPKKAA